MVIIIMLLFIFSWVRIRPNTGAWSCLISSPWGQYNEWMREITTRGTEIHIHSNDIKKTPNPQGGRDMLGTPFHFKEMFGLKLCLCLVFISQVAAQGYFSQMVGGPEGMDPFAQQRQMGMEFIDAQMEASEALPPMQQKQYMKQLNRQKMALSQNYGYHNHQQYQRSSANRAVYPIQPKPNNIQTPYGVSGVQNSGYQGPFYMQQHRHAYNGFQQKPQTNVFVVDPRQYPSEPQKAVQIPNQRSQNNPMSPIPQTGQLQIMIPRVSRPMVRPMAPFAQLPQIIIVSRRKPELNNTPTLQPTTQKLIQGKNSANRDSKYDQNSGTTVKPQVTTPADVRSTAQAIITTPKASDSEQKRDMIKTSNSQYITKDKNVNIHEVIDDALKAHIKSKQKALEAALQTQLLAKQKALEAALKTQILNKHKTLEAALNAEIMTKHRNSEAALSDQILKKQRTLETLLKAQMLSKHKALEAAMEALTKQNLEKAQAIKTIGMTDKNQPLQSTNNELTGSSASDKNIKSKSQEAKLTKINLGSQDSVDKIQQVSTVQQTQISNIQPSRLSAKLRNQQQIFGKSQFRTRVGSDTQSLINNMGVNILGTVQHLSRGHQIQANTRLNDSTDNKKIPNQAYEEKTTDYIVESTTVQTVTSTPKPKIVQPPETVQESQNQQLPIATNNDVNSSRRIPKLVIKLSGNESNQRNLLRNMKSSERNQLVNYFLRRMVRQPQRETSRITRTVSA
ncbi:hypothetical protein LOTGIDRAFT_231967 [Lottia gigantea]|uniref:Uncharacterized protein n=1 Tax=Lottia gigantea TaxID=225164 RepID=V4AQ65_LOTGI|nr:hypothetical protein LOTGIDRAFT_231967 [Lottia gigantea]ESO95806.1 hypothetical protein LOTGIDRAFT_231967 [Lottia gigantea]